MSRALVFGLALGVFVAAYACGPRQVPPGTPPPEYERRAFSPWPEAGSQAGEPPPVLEPAAPSASAPGAPEPLDAGAPPVPLDAGALPVPLDAAPPGAGGTPAAP